MNTISIRKRLLSYFYRKIGIYFFALWCNIVYKPWIFLFGKHDRRKMRYEVSLCLIFKDEAPFLKEWLDYHLTIGVSHFYLYNNNSEDNFYTILQPYIEDQLVTLITWPKMQAQMEAYEDCMNRFSKESKWIAFIDADEFICMKYELDIRNWIKRFDKYPAVNIQWLIFGSGGIMKHDYNKNVIEQYTICWDHFFKFGKTIVNTRFKVANFNTMFAHHHTYVYYPIMGLKSVVPAINQFGYICPCGLTWGGGRDKLRNSTIQINHYYSKGFDVYSQKMNKTDVFYEINPKGAVKFFNKECECISSNYTIFRFLIKMKLFQSGKTLKSSEKLLRK